jgi:peroxiredoxin
MKARLTLRLAIILSLILIMTSCGGATAIPQIGDKAPDFTLATIEGNSLSLSDYHGKIVLIVFTSVNCVDCEKQTPYIEAVCKESSERLTVLTVYQCNAANMVRDYVAKKQLIAFPALPDPKGDVAKTYGVIRNPPANILIDPQGIIRVKKVGPFQSKEEIEKEIDKICGSP